ncbi:hypothetical protein [Winogradskyella sp.]|uniref:OB-fold protein n=1 Tax=Winogradskyella sp. TaxID=1883156 RepID=UPI002639E24A|nr:hypothetical protein [Winogradskyella sp.]
MYKNIVFKVSVVVVILILVGFVFAMFGKKDTSRIKTKTKLSSSELLQKTTNSDSLLLNDYIEKAIEVTGPIKDITIKDNKVTILLHGGHESRLVICEMQTNQNKYMDQLSKGEVVNIKGVFKGVLLDAILLNCIIIEKNRNG